MRDTWICHKGEGTIAAYVLTTNPDELGSGWSCTTLRDAYGSLVDSVRLAKALSQAGGALRRLIG